MTPHNKFIPINHREGDCSYLSRHLLTEPSGLIFQCRLWLKDLGNPPQPTTICQQENPQWKCTQ